jgi:hypothetical protein
MSSLTETAHVALSTTNTIQQTTAPMSVSEIVSATLHDESANDHQAGQRAQSNHGLKRPFVFDEWDEDEETPEESARRAAAAAEYRRQEEKRRRKLEKVQAELNQINTIRAASGRPPLRSAAIASDSNRRANDEAGRIYDADRLDDMGTSIGYDYITKAGKPRKV